MIDNVRNIAPQIEVKQSEPDIIVLKFADSKIPVFKESRNKDYIKYGEDNCYPDYLTYLYNKSAKHNAIVTGKAFYIFGEGFENGNLPVNRTGDSLNDISKKCLLDIEIYGGFRLEIIWNAAGRISEIYHVDYTTIRVGKDGGFWYKETWDKNNRDEEQFIPAFNPLYPVGTQIYAYNEYRPMARYYPLPSYIGANNYIETDIEISKYYLSSIRNGMMPSKMVQFFSGEPPDEKKAEIEKRLSKKFSGAENAGKFFLVFNAVNASKSVEVNDLSASDLDKHMIELNKTCQQEIFSGHLVTSPMLFGIKTEGQLGGTTELKTAYEIFINTYAKPKADAYNKEINYLFSFSQHPGTYELRATDPIGVQFDVKDVISSIPKDFIFEKLGIPKELWDAPNVSGSTPAAPSLDSDIPQIPVNDNLKNLSARQLQHVNRVVRQYKKGLMTEVMAKTLLRTGLGLTEEDINNILGIQPVAMSFEEQEEAIVAMFDECGESRADFEILKSKRVCFEDDWEAEEDEKLFIEQAFKTLDVTRTEDEILNLIKKDPKITPEVIAETIGQTKSYVTSKLKSLEKRGILETATETIGSDTIISRSVPEAVEIGLPPSVTTNPPVQVLIKYSYEVKPGIGPAIIPTTRPFCRKLIGLNRLYSRAEIEAISLRLGYSVWDRKGGWWGKNQECRHRWVSNIVVKKK